MDFFAFRLDSINILSPRGRIPDNDIVTFSVFVNQRELGRGAGLFPALTAGHTVPAAAVVPDSRSGMSKDWIVGPLELAPGDLIHVVYSGTNISDSQLDTSGQAEIELRILAAIAQAAIGAAAAGLPGAVVGAITGAIGDVIKTLLGYSPQGPCNGVVFVDELEFSGAGLTNTSYRRPTSYATLPDATEAPFVRQYTDEATHDSDTCGDLARTEVTVAALRIPFVSARYYLRRRFPGQWHEGRLVPDFAQGLRQLEQPGTVVSLRSLLGLRR